jgi:hypothetical protein
VNFDGEHYEVKNVGIEPRMADPPRVLSAGGGVERDGVRRVASRVKERIRQADGWIVSSHSTLDDALQDWDDIAAYIRSRGGEHATYDTIALYRTYLVPGADSENAREIQERELRSIVDGEDNVPFAKDSFRFGAVETLQDELRRYVDNGFDEIIVIPTATDYEKLLDQITYIKDYFVKEIH